VIYVGTAKGRHARGAEAWTARWRTGRALGRQLQRRGIREPRDHEDKI